MISNLSDTIAAIATPSGFGGIGIIRISGCDAVSIAGKIFKPDAYRVRENDRNAFEKPGFSLKARYLYHGHIFNQQRVALDEVLLVYMPAPFSYTKEDVVEIQAHAGAISLKRILELVLYTGARIADPGEFTRRAYMNGRIDLSQAEAVIDLIQAKTEAALRIATRHLDGGIRDATNVIRDHISDIQVCVEAGIDFPEDLDEIMNRKKICHDIFQEILNPLEEILEGYRRGHLIREGLRIVILGRANVGKSSLLNRLVKKERALVTAFAGTTRDCIEEAVDVFGLPVVIVDTAGLRDTDDPVEKLGMDRTRDVAENADLIVFMMNADSGIVLEDSEIYGRIKNKKKILVFNKIDLLEDAADISIPETWDFFKVIYTSAKFGTGIEALKKEIYNFGTDSGNAPTGEAIPNLRQKRLFEKCHEAMRRCLKGFKEKLPSELIAIDLQEAVASLDEITGTAVKTDVLDAIFSRFCIGK